MTPAERETVIQFDDGDEMATIYTCHRRWQTRLRRMGFEPEASDRGGETYRVPRAFIGLPRAPRQGQSLSPEQKIERKKALSKAREARWQNPPRPRQKGESPGRVLAHLEGEEVVWAHSAEVCAGPPCPIHKCTDHHMRGFPQHWRDDRRLMERVCPHGVGHPDPDDPSEDRVHGCDGCCVGVEA